MVVELFRNCKGFSITPEEVLIICLLNTIQEKSVLVKVQEAIDSKTTWETVQNLIVKIDNEDNEILQNTTKTILL